MIGAATAGSAGRLQPAASLASESEPRPSAVLLVTMVLIVFGLLMMTSASVEIAAKPLWRSTILP